MVYRTRRVAAIERESTTSSSDSRSESGTSVEHTEDPVPPSVLETSQPSVPHPTSDGHHFPEHQWASKGYCCFCRKTVTRVLTHMNSRHEELVTPAIASIYNWDACACGAVCKKIKIHWGQHCPLPPGQRRLITDEAALDENDGNEVNRELEMQVTMRRRSGISLLYDVLKNDEASENEIYEAYEVLAELPSFRKIFKPAEISLINECVTRISQRYLQYAKDCDLFRLHCIMKVGCAPFMIKGRLGKMRTRLRKFPKLDDEECFKRALNDYKLRLQGIIDGPNAEQLIHSKLEKGQPGSAFKILRDSHGIAPASQETIDKLNVLHPSEQEHLWNINRGRNEPKISFSKVSEVMRSISRETTGGPSGLDGSFLNAVRFNESFQALLWKMTRQIANGTQSLPRLLLSSRLIPLRKNSAGDIRPIAVGEIIFRTCCRVIMKASKFELLRNQFGVRSKNGVEPLIHLARLRCEREALVSVDIKNAFNSIRRDFVYGAVADRAPELIKCFSWAYGRKSPLFVEGKHSLDSSSGVRQGDPLAPLYFSLGYAKILADIEQNLRENGLERDMSVMSYLDDTYLFSRAEDKERVLGITLDVFRRFEASSGLRIRSDKTWSCDPSDFRANGITLLGAHIGGKQDDFIDEKAEEFDGICSKLKNLNAQDCMLLLRMCGIPQVNHLLRTVEPHQTCWDRFDSSIKSTVLYYLRRFEIENVNEDLLMLPIRHGGLGLPFPSMISKAALEASQSESYSMLEKRERNLILPTVDDTRPQKVRVREIHKESQARLEGMLTDFQLRRFVDNSSQGGSLFLQAYPSEPNSTFSDAEFSSALAYRLLNEIHVCRKCDNIVEEGHDQSCRSLYSLRVRRHELVKKGLGKILSEAGAEVQLEVFARNNDGRRCDVLASGQLVGGNVAIDVSGTAIHGADMASSFGNGCKKSQRELNSIIEARVARKVRENCDLDYGGVFLPFIFSVGGTLNGEAIEFLKKWRKVSPRSCRRFKFYLSCILAKMRAQMWMKCRLAPY